jgi:3-keto-5-aminohexanoate cleavage enzyme
MSDTVIISLAPVAADCPELYPKNWRRKYSPAWNMARPSFIYVRDKQGRLTPDTVDFQATIDPVIRHSNLIIQASTGGVSSLSIAERCAPLACSAWRWHR